MSWIDERTDDELQVISLWWKHFNVYNTDSIEHLFICVPKFFLVEILFFTVIYYYDIYTRAIDILYVWRRGSWFCIVLLVGAERAQWTVRVVGHESKNFLKTIAVLPT
jgi:hypothetical protein